VGKGRDNTRGGKERFQKKRRKRPERKGEGPQNDRKLSPAPAQGKGRVSSTLPRKEGEVLPSGKGKGENAAPSADTRERKEIARWLFQAPPLRVRKKIVFFLLFGGRRGEKKKRNDQYVFE